jgi:hypothetical protein
LLRLSIQIISRAVVNPVTTSSIGKDGIPDPEAGCGVAVGDAADFTSNSLLSSLGVKDAELKTVELLGTGDTITELGEYRMKLQTEGQRSMEDKGKYIVVWKKTSDGWKLHRDMWSSNLPSS